MLQSVLDRIKQYLRTRQQPSTTGRTQFTAEEARDNRASSMVTLQREVRQLQQEITDLSAAQDLDSTGDDARANESTMERLHRELAQKQKELAKFQARV